MPCEKAVDHGGLEMTDTIVVGFDGSGASQRAVAFAAKQAKSIDAALHLVHVLEWSPYSFHTPDELAERHKRREQELSRARAVLQPAVDTLSQAGQQVTSEARHGNTADLLCEIAAEKKASQIVIGRKGTSALANRILGSMAINLMQCSPVPVTIVP
jgi:nucleotide-binding universal stress UspA family protein